MSGGRVIVLSGPPASGKTTVSRLLASCFDNSVHFESDWFWTTIVGGPVPPWSSEADAQNRIVIRAYASAAGVMAVGGYLVVLDGIVGPWTLDIVAEEVERAGARFDHIVLRPRREEVLQRATGRVDEVRIDGHPPLREEAPILQMWNEFSDLGRYEECAIDNSELTPEATVESIVRAMALRQADKGQPGFLGE